MLEKRFTSVPPQAFTADGAANGIITIDNTAHFKVKQEIILRADTLPNLELEVKQVYSTNQMRVGPRGKPIADSADVSAYTTALNAAIFANEQSRPKIPFEEHTRAVYEEEPTVATRVIGVGRTGSTVNWEQDGITPTEWDDVQLEYDIDQFVTDVEFFLRGESLTHLELTYDINKRLVRARKIY